MIWHHQKKLDQGSSARDKPEGYTLEFTSACPIRLRTKENKAHRGTKYTGELPPEWSQGLPPPRLPKRPPTGKRSPSPSPPPRTPQPPSRSSRWHRGRGGFPTSSPCRNKAYNATTPQKPPPYIPQTRKRTNAAGTRGPPIRPKRHPRPPRPPPQRPREARCL